MRSHRWRESSPPRAPTPFAQQYTGTVVSAHGNTQGSRFHSTPKTQAGVSQKESAANMPFGCLFAVNRSLNGPIGYGSHENKSPCVEHFSQQRRYPLQGHQNQRVAPSHGGERGEAQRAGISNTMIGWPPARWRNLSWSPCLHLHDEKRNSWAAWLTRMNMQRIAPGHDCNEAVDIGMDGRVHGMQTLLRKRQSFCR